MTGEELILALSVALTPARNRGIHEEQWRADLRDGPEMGISRSSLLFGTVLSSATARIHDVRYRGSKLLSQSTRGKKMKVTLGIIGAAAAIAGVTAFGIHTAQPEVSHRPQDSMTIGGYEGWWNATPVEGSSAGLPQETVAVNTQSGEIVDAFSRSKNDAGQPTLVSDVNFRVAPDASWPKDSVVIIDTSSGKVIDNFPVDAKGWPVISAESSKRSHDAATSWQQRSQ